MVIDIELVKELKLFKKMYCRLFSAVSSAIEQCSDPVTKNLLISAQQEAEEIYINEDIF